MLRGTRSLFGREAVKFRTITTRLILAAQSSGWDEYVPSLLSEQEVFVEKAGPEVLSQMYAFNDKGDRPICLIPEVTAVVQREYKDNWSKAMPKPVRLWYLTRCYRYERPQEGRYREFTQFGVECLGGKEAEWTKDRLIDFLDFCLKSTGLKDFSINSQVKRGLDYYTEDGFEVEVPILGAQKQVAGGGRYDCGIGWAIGVDRLVLAIEKQGGFSS